MSTMLAALLALIVGFVAGWAAHRSDSRAYIESRARHLARQMAVPPLPQPVYTEVVDTEVVPAWATRLERKEVTR